MISLNTSLGPWSEDHVFDSVLSANDGAEAFHRLGVIQQNGYVIKKILYDAVSRMARVFGDRSIGMQLAIVQTDGDVPYALEITPFQTVHGAPSHLLAEPGDQSALEFSYQATLRRMDNWLGTVGIPVNMREQLELKFVQGEEEARTILAGSDRPPVRAAPAAQLAH